MTILDEVEASIRQQAEGAGSSMVGIGQWWGVGSGIVPSRGPGSGQRARRARRSGHGHLRRRAAAGQPVGGVDNLFDALRGAQGGALELRVVRGTDERTVQVVFTPEIEGK